MAKKSQAATKKSSAADDFEMDEDGRMVIPDDDDDEDDEDDEDDGDDEDGEAGAEATYLESLTNEDAYTRVGRTIKFSNKRKRGRDADDDMEVDEDDEEAPKSEKPRQGAHGQATFSRPEFGDKRRKKNEGGYAVNATGEEYRSKVRRYLLRQHSLLLLGGVFFFVTPRDA
jgi:hypothetical protein